MAFADQSIGEFLAAVASENLTPSGGAVAAVAGAAGAALCEMACRHTVANDGDTDADLAAHAADLEIDRVRLLDLADADAAAVEAVFHGAEDDTPDDASAERATEVPLQTAEASFDVLERAVTVVAASDHRAVPDAVTGAFLAHAAIQASTATVRTNLAAMDDETYVATARTRADEIEQHAADALDRVWETLETG